MSEAVLPDSAWELYLAGEDPGTQVRRTIREAQTRCRAYAQERGAAPHEPSKGMHPGPRVLAGQHRALRGAAQPFLRGLHEFLAARAHLILLGDDAGRLLCVFADSFACAIAAATGVREGSNWSERHMGPNGIGTALLLDSPVAFVGPDHLLADFSTWTFIGVPLHLPDRSAAGALALVVPNEDVDVYTWRYMLSIAAGIECQLAVRVARARQRGAGVPVHGPADPAGGPQADSASAAGRLQALDALLARECTPQQLLQALIEQGLEGAAVHSALLVRSGTGGMLERVAAFGPWDAEMDPCGGVPIPVAEAAATRQAVWLEDTRAVLERYPILAPAQGLSNCCAFAALPLLSPNGRALGAVAIRFAEARAFGASERAWMLVLAQECARALERLAHPTGDASPASPGTHEDA